MNQQSEITRRTLLQAAGLSAAATTFAGRSIAQQRAVQPAPYMPAPKFIHTNGIRMAVYEQGAGIPVVLSHGFPELAFSWRHQVKALSAAGFRAIAPDQRGYGLTDRPATIADYDLQHLCDDMAGLLDALDIEKAVFCGHDWGGGVVWTMVRLHPDRCLGIIGVNTPSPRPPGLPSREPTEESLIVMTENYYVAQFQEPGHAEAALEKDVILRPSSADGMGDFIDDFETYTVEDCGHWTQQEKPDELNEVLIDWLRRKIRG